MKKEETMELLKLYRDEKVKVQESFPLEGVGEIVDLVWDTYRNSGTVYACGNGGNASYVGNLACDFANHPFVSDDKTKPMSPDIKRLKVFDLTASRENITALLNDIGKEYIFSQQLKNNGIGKFDLVFGFSGSGNSGNIIEALKTARDYKAKTIAIVRGDGGKIAKEGLADKCIIIPGTSQFPGQVGGNDNNFHYEDSLSEITHMVTGILRKRVTGLYEHGKEISA